MNWRVILIVARKDIIDAVKNLYILFGLVLPIGMSLLLRLMFAGPDDPGTLTVVVYDPTGSRLVTELRALPQVHLLEVDSAQQLTAEVEKNAVGGLALPVNLDAAVDAGEQAEITVYLNHRRGGGGIAAFQRLVEQQVWAMTGQAMPAHIVWADVTAPPGLQAESAFRMDLFLLTMFLVMALAMTGAFVVPLLLVEEKEKHTLEFLLISPAGPAEVVAGKALTGLVYSLLIAGILIALNQGWVGDWPVTLLALLLGALFMVAVGLLMGSVCRTTMHVNTWSSIVMLVLMAPSWLIALQMPTALETALRLIPTHYLVKVLKLALTGDASLVQVWGDLALLLGSVVLAFAAVVWALRREDR
ncbi:MAG: ABC transporter permease [Ardenticatenales bacterium]|nr:ABC transporter permease [Ardenticatenales bacterium]